MACARPPALAAMRQPPMRERIWLQLAHGLPRASAQALARRWQLDGEQRFGLHCEAPANADSGEQLLLFTRRGLSGQLRVGDTHFTLDVELGHFLSHFRPRIEAALHENLRRALHEAGAGADADAGAADAPPQR